MSISSNDSFDDENTLFADGGEEDINYYIILNVPKDATIDEITKAYKQRCLIFHPDRHVNEEDKKEAAKMFVLLRQAYETLSNPQLRSVYDAVGTCGLEVEGWQLLHRSSNPENIRKEYEFLKRLHDNELMLQRVHPTSSLTAKVSLAGLFAENPSERYLPELFGMDVSQGIECPLTSQDRVGLSGSLKASNGVGNCSITTSYLKSIGSSTHAQTSLTLTPESVGVSAKLSRSIGQRIAVFLQPNFGYNMTVEKRTFSLTSLFTMELRPTWNGTLTFNYVPGGNSSLTTTVMKTELGFTKFLGSLTVSANPTIRINYNMRYPEFNDLRYQASCMLSFFSFTPSLYVERRLTRYSKVGASIICSLPNGFLTAKFRLKTKLNTFETQLTLCDSADDLVCSTLYGVLLPLLVTQVAKIVFKRPLARLMRLFDNQTENEQVNECRKEEAQRIVHLMRESFEKIRREEERKSGLVVVEAHYGQLADDGAEQYPVAGERLIDVTIPIQTLVNDSQLRIFSTKEQLPGFYDPCPGYAKVLRVVYKFRNELHAITVNDDQALNIPMRTHLVRS